MANEVKLKLAIEGGQVVSATLDGVSTKLDGVDRSARGASGGVGQLKSVMAGIVTVGAALEILRMADACTSLRTNLLLSSNGASEARVAYQRLYEIAQQSRVGFTALGDTYATIARAGRELGVSQDRLLTVTQAIGMAMTIGGGSAQSMQAALVQLGQGLSSGTLRGEELNSILEQTPRLARALADGMGVSVGQLRALGEQGKITADAVISALEKSAPQLAKEMSGAAMTVGQAYTMLTNSVTKFVGDADTASGASGNLASVLQGLSTAVDSVGAAINNHKDAFSAIVNGLAGAAAFAGVVALASGIRTVTTAVIALGVAMAANPAILALTLIAAAGAGIASLASDWKKSAEGMRAQMDGINADIRLAEERAATGSEPVKARAALELQTLKDKRDALRQTMVVQEQSSAENASYNAKEMKNLQERVAAEQSAYAGAKPLDEVRKMVKTRNSILIEANDQAVNIAMGFNKSIANAASPEKVIELSQERDQLLIEHARGTTAALKSFDDQRAAPAKTAAKQRLDAVIQYYEAEQIAITAGEQRASQTLAAQHSAGLVTDQAYYLAKRTMAEADNAAQQTLIQREIEAVKQSGLSKQDQAAQLDRFNQDLKRLREAAKDIEANFVNEMTVLDMKLFRAANDENASYIESQQAKATSLEQQVKAQRQANAEIGLSAREINNLRSATMQLNAAELDRQADKKEETLQNAADIQALRDQATAMRQLITENARGVEKTAAVDSFKSLWESVDQTARSVWTNIFQGGQDVFTKLRDVAKATFLDWLYQMTVRKWIFNILAVVTGTSAGSVASTVLGSGAGSGAANTVGQASTAASAMNWLNDFGGSVTGLVDKAGAWLMNSGSSVLGDIGASMVSNSTVIGQYAQYAGDAVGYVNALVKASEGKWGAAIGSALGTYFGGPIGSFIGNTIGSWIDNAFGGGHEYSVANGIRVHAGADGMSSQTFDQWRNDGSSGIFGIGGAAASSGANFAPTDDKVSKQLNDNYTVLKAQTMAYTAVLGLNTDAIKGYTADMQLNLTNMNPQEIQAAVAKMFTDIANSMAGQVLDPKYVQEGETASVALKRMGDSLMAVNGVFSVLGYTLLDVSAAGGAAASGLVSAMGGLQAFQSQMMSYYQNYYSPEEQRTNTINSVVGNLDKAGIHFTADQISGASRADIRAVVEQYAARVDTDAGQKQYAEVVKAANLLTSVTSVTPATTATQQKVEQVGSSGGGGGGGGSSAASQVQSALKQYTDAIFGEVKRIREDMLGTDEQALAAVRAKFELANIQANAGSEDALKALPALSQSMLTLAKVNTSTALELRMIQAQTAATLEKTGTTVAQKYGFSVPAFAGGGSHSGGWAMVGENGPELAYMPPARIYTAPDTSAIIAGSGRNAVPDGELLNTMRDVRALLTEIKTAATEGSDYSYRLYDLFDRLIPYRDAVPTKAA